jgi:hypothetical protein
MPDLTTKDLALLERVGTTGCFLDHPVGLAVRSVRARRAKR